MKKNMLIKILILLFVTIALSACSNNESDTAYHNNGNAVYDGIQETFISFDVVIYEEVEEITDMATHIIRGEILDQRTEWLDLNLSREETEQHLAELGLNEEEIEAEIYSVRPDGTTDELEPELVTISRVRVLEVFQGDHNIGDVIEIMQTGGEYGYERWTVEDAVKMETGSELVLFLVSWELAGLPYSLISHMQGVYYVPDEVGDEENLVELDDVETELEAVSETDPVTITIEDLIEIAVDNELLDE